MTIYEFTLRIDREVTEDEVDALYGVLDDGSVTTGPGVTEIEFARDATGWAEAIGTAIRDLEGIAGLTVSGAGQEDLVSIPEIAYRAQRSREAVRLWAVGKRGPGGFPDAEWQSPGGERYWSWTEVAVWIQDNLHLAVERAPDEIRWANDILRARQAIAEAHRILDEDEGMRREFGSLLAPSR